MCERRGALARREEEAEQVGTPGQRVTRDEPAVGGPADVVEEGEEGLVEGHGGGVAGAQHALVVEQQQAFRDPPASRS